MISKAIFSILILAIAFAVTIQAGTVVHVSNVPRTEQNVVSGVTFTAEPRAGVTGRSLILKSFLLAPIGIALLLVAAAILFVPIPAVTTGRQFSGFENRAYQLAKTVLNSDECIERISCEVSRASKKHELTAWVPEALERYLRRGQWSDKISRGLFSSDQCKRFVCDPATSFKKAFKANT